jgi:hypothetical protein
MKNKNNVPSDIYYIESRYYVFNAKLLEKKELSDEKLRDIINGFSGELLSADNVSLSIIDHPLYHYTEPPQLLKIELAASILNQLNEKYCKGGLSDFKLCKLDCFLTDINTLGCYTVFRLTDLEDIEENSMKLIDLASSIREDVYSLFCHLEDHGNNIIKIDHDYKFGIPRPLWNTKDVVDNDYVYDQHLVFFNQNEFRRTKKQYNQSNKLLADDCVDNNKIAIGWSTILWDMTKNIVSEDELIKKVFIDSLAFSEAAIYDVAIVCYNGFLKIIIDDESKKIAKNGKRTDGLFDNQRKTLFSVWDEKNRLLIRKVINANCLLLEDTKLWHRNFTVNQYRINNKLRESLCIDELKNNFIYADKALRESIVDLDVKQDQESSQVIEATTSAFAILSLFSIAEFLYTILTIDSKTLLKINLFSTRVIIFLFPLITTLFLGFILYRLLKRKYKKK